MKKVWMGAMIAGCAIAMLGMQARAQDAANDATRGQDQTFCHAAEEGGMFEVQTGQLAAEKAEAQDVKDFGQKMVHDHTILNDQVKPVCAALGVNPSDHLDAKDQAEYDRLNGLSGKEFDQAYIKVMVMDHRHDLRAFRHEEATTQDTQLKQTVDGGITVITEHLRLITGLAQKHGVSVPTRGAA